MALAIETKFKIGDEVWVAFSPRYVTFDDCLPVLKMKIEQIRVNATFNEDESDNTVRLSYYVKQIDNWGQSWEDEGKLFSNKTEAESKALSLVKNYVSQEEENYRRAEKMLSLVGGEI